MARRPKSRLLPTTLFPKRRSTLVLLLLALLIALSQIRVFRVFHQSATRSDVEEDEEKAGNPSITTETNSKQQQQVPPLRNDNNSTFSACLLVMDDNHFLMEWLAYHYHTLPLRYLVIAVDPRSRTSPKPILDRWENHMTIVRWSDRHFLPNEWIGRNVREDDPTAKLMKHRERQRNFYPTCFEFLKSANRQWTMVIDIDEFATQNVHYLENNGNNNNNSNNTNATTATPTKYPTLLQAIPRHYDTTNTTCVTMPRVRFGNYQDGNSTTTKTLFAPNGFDDPDFLTLRWRWRAGLHSRKDNRNPKSMINVGLIHNFSRQDTDAHRPVRSECPKRNLYVLNRASPFSVHHYIGTQRQWDFRKDARDGMKQRNQEKFKEYGQIHHEMDESICGWLNEFCHKYGYQQAKAWLDGVGNVSYTTMTTPKRVGK
jgi:hypothetical protein